MSAVQSIDLVEQWNQIKDELGHSWGANGGDSESSRTIHEPNEKAFVDGDDHREDEAIVFKSSSVGWQFVTLSARVTSDVFRSIRNTKFVHAPKGVDPINGAETNTVHTNEELLLNALRSAETYLSEEGK